MRLVCRHTRLGSLAEMGISRHVLVRPINALSAAGLSRRRRIGANREKYRERKKIDRQRYRASHPERKAAETKRWFAKNRDKKRQYRRNRKALEKGAVGSHTNEDISEILKLQKDRCAYCQKKINDTYHVDHIIALSRGGSNDRTNLQLTCGPCNQRKKDQDPLDFARSRGKLL